MKEDVIFVTISHIDDFDKVVTLKSGDRLILRKERDNESDDEAIAVYKKDMKCGYVANSVSEVARGTYSAGRVYDRMEDQKECVMRFLFAEDGHGIAQVL